MTTKIITISNQTGGVVNTAVAGSLAHALTRKYKQVLLKEDVRAIAMKHTLPVGDVVWFFVLEGPKTFRNGSLQIQPSPKSIGKTMFQEGY